MLAITLLLSLGSLICCALCEVIRRSVIAGALSRNGAMGIRTKATKSSDEAWERGHRAALPWLLATVATAGLPAVAAVALAIVSGIADGEASSVTGIGGITFAVVSYINLMTFGVIGAVVADRAAKSEPAPEI